VNPDPSLITDLASRYWDSCVLFTASDLGVFETLAKAGAADSIMLAQWLGLNPRGARLLLDGCVAIGLLAKEGEQYRNTSETSAFLVPGGPGNLSETIRYHRDVYGAWGRLPALVRTGLPVERPEIHPGEDADRTRTFVVNAFARTRHRAHGCASARPRRKETSS
jgi:hypothetical protein